MPISKAGPIKVSLSQKDLEISCNVAYQDESTAQYDLESLSIRGAQREVTRFLVGEGYLPMGRWEPQTDDGSGSESVRRFRPEAEQRSELGTNTVD